MSAEFTAFQSKSEESLAGSTAAVNDARVQFEEGMQGLVVWLQEQIQSDVVPKVDSLTTFLTQKYTMLAESEAMLNKEKEQVLKMYNDLMKEMSSIFDAAH